MSRSAEEFLIKEHEEYLNRITESGMPIWLMDYYDRINSQWKEEHLKNQNHETNNQNFQPTDRESDYHFFI